ncbi:MAG: YggT family protein [Vicinamibacteria bacterium]
MAPGTNQVAEDEARRVAQHGAVKAKLENDVHERIQTEAASTNAAERDEVRSVAAGLKHNAASEVGQSESELQRARKATRGSQFIDYAFYLVYGLIGLEIVLDLLGARQSSGFKQFLDAMTFPFLGPFKGLMPDPRVGSMQLMLSYVVGLVVYMLLHMAINGLLRMFAQKKATI